jgi:hypothetical protein
MRALLIAATVSLFGHAYAAPTRAEQRAAQSLPGEHPIACAPKGANCKTMNGSNPEPNNNICCSQHCTWDNGSQAYLCD